MGEQDQFTEELHPGSVEISGRVKWFNAAKGFGFLTPVDNSGDVFIHLSTLRQAGHESVEEGATVVCEAVLGPKGLQAIRLINVDAATATHLGPALPEDDTWRASAIFHEPGTYVLRALASDGALNVDSDIVVTVTP